MQTVRLNNNVEMPVLGYGLFQVPPRQAERFFDFALAQQDMLDIAALNRYDNGFRDFADTNYRRRILDMFDL